ncbi:protein DETOXIFICATION 55 [Musa acuminata AAA Group]|uniref:protein DETOXIFICATION 55 n=1 Tax=Musa acuminata AAA Group TaxID=214697 RepID=UPI0031D45399
MVTGDQIHKCLTISEVSEELKRMKDVGLPITVINLVSYIKGMASVACMGRLGRLELAGGALAVGFTNVTGYSVLAGLAMGMEPICSQAFGSRNLSLASRALRRTILLLLLVSLPIALLWINLRPIMRVVRQDSDVARVAACYCRFALPDLLANSLLQPLRVYFRCKGAPCPLMWCMSLAVVIHVPLTASLSSAIGVPGVAIATCLTDFNTLLLLLACVISSRTADEAAYLPIPSSPTTCSSYKPWSEWSSLIRLALPSCLAVCLEWWWYELMTVASGYLSNPRVSLATAAIVIQTTSLMYTLPTTLSTSVSARVGNELGAGQPRRAQTAAAVGMGLAVAGSCISLLWATVGREAWGRVFTGDGEVLELTKAVLPVIGLCELANCPQTTGCGVLRGSARPSVAAAINLYAFYLVGAPVALLLAFRLDLGFLGLSLGLLTAQVACALPVVYLVRNMDWEREASKAVDLVGSGRRALEGEYEEKATLKGEGLQP